MEKLEQDDFCINLQKKHQVQQLCTKEQTQIQKQARQQISIQQQIFNRIKA